ncbi:glycoside hydrolase family protein [uncultured Salegentibacter sp.]|uniref:glycoside hydrolase family protein n=1 Tax=uncultured Salegentibacter sp. TaxID=259320 RepID=UPI00259256BE|nr:glycoside hydrolase family protein [uncultured Salegentibacter sp.]
MAGLLFSCKGNKTNSSKKGESVSDNLNFMELIQAVPEKSKLEDDNWFTWGASVQKGDDGKYHMIYCRWPKKYAFSDGWLMDAELCYATAENPLGPFTYEKTILKGRKSEGLFHAWDGASVYNPHLKKFEGKYYLYYTGTSDPFTKEQSVNRGVLVRHQRIGVVVFNSFEDLKNGKFKRSKTPLLKPLSNFGYNVPKEEEFGDSLNISVANIVVVNPSVEKRPDGKYIMVFKSWQDKKSFAPIHGVAISNHPDGGFKVQKEPILKVLKDDGNVAMAEDPFIWYNNTRNLFYALVRDFNGDITGKGHSMALFKSVDGTEWSPAKNVLASDLKLRWENGSSETVARLERPQLLMDEQGEPLVLFSACAIQSPSNENGHSFNIHIPLKSK